MHCHTHTQIGGSLIVLLQMTFDFLLSSLPIEAPDWEVVKNVLMYTFLNNVSWKKTHIYLVKVESYCQEYYSKDQELSVT